MHLHTGMRLTLGQFVQIRPHRARCTVALWLKYLWRHYSVSATVYSSVLSSHFQVQLFEECPVHCIHLPNTSRAPLYLTLGQFVQLRPHRGIRAQVQLYAHTVELSFATVSRVSHCLAHICPTPGFIMAPVHLTLLYKPSAAMQLSSSVMAVLYLSQCSSMEIHMCSH